MGSQNTNLTVTAPCNGVLVSGAKITKIETMDWTKISNASLITLQQICNGGVNDCEVEVHGCLEGGESVYEILATLNSSSSRHTYIFDKCFDKIRLKVTKFLVGGRNSRILMSARP